MLIGSPIAGKNSEPQHYEQKVQKQKDLMKTWVSTGKFLKISDERKTETIFSTFEKRSVEHTTLKCNCQIGTW